MLESKMIGYELGPMFNCTRFIQGMLYIIRIGSMGRKTRIQVQNDK